MTIKLCSLIAALLLLLSSSSYVTYSLDVDIKCNVYKHSADQNGDNVDVRIFVMGLKAGSYYKAQVIPDRNPSMTVITKTDLDGIFWALGKVPNGEKSLLFKVKV